MSRGRYQGSWGELSVPEDRLLWLPSVSILLSAGIFPHCEARRGSEAPLLLLLLLQTQGRAAEGGRQERWGWGGREGGGVSAENTHGCIDTHADARQRRQRQAPPPTSFSRSLPRPRTSPLPLHVACLYSCCQWRSGAGVSPPFLSLADAPVWPIRAF